MRGLLPGLLLAGCMQPVSGTLECRDAPWPTSDRLFGTDSGARFGYAATAIPDISGDGLPDLVVGSPAFEGFSGRVTVLHSPFVGGAGVAVGTLDHDDVVLGVKNVPGLTGFGSAVATVEPGGCVAISAPFATRGDRSALGWVGTFDPATVTAGEPLSWWAGARSGQRLGREMAPFGASLAVGAPQDNLRTLQTGAVYVVADPCGAGRPDRDIQAEPTLFGVRARERTGHRLHAATLSSSGEPEAPVITVGGGTALILRDRTPEGTTQRVPKNRSPTWLSLLPSDELDVEADLDAVIHPDLDGDGISDAVVRSSTGELSVFLGPLVPGTLAQAALVLDTDLPLGALALGPGPGAGSKRGQTPDIWLGVVAPGDTKILRISASDLDGSTATVRGTCYQRSVWGEVGDRLVELGDLDGDGALDLGIPAYKANNESTGAGVGEPGEATGLLELVLSGQW
ncbi:MAG: hypothetical protein ACI8PZ_000482 [Myxococcota bacterium]|jgi:hypothetical protein